MKRKRCYYDVLQISMTSTLSQIRHSYHKLAMRYHPDKNKTDSAKEHFQEINEAYSILSDPSEKTFYDRHRETIIKNWNLGFNNSPEDLNKEMSMIPAEGHFWPFFTRPAYLGFDDSEYGFYTVYRRIFKAIQADVEQLNNFEEKSEEMSIVDPETQYLIMKAPSFGDSETKLLDVVQFYIYWENLPNILEEIWRNLSYSDIEDEQELMLEDEEEETRRLHERFVEIIRNIVAYVKRIDPRYLEYLKNKQLLDNVPFVESGNVEERAIDVIDPQNEIEMGHDVEHCLECWNWALLNLKRVLDSKIPPIMMKFPGELVAEKILPLPMMESNPSGKMMEEEENEVGRKQS